MKLSKRLETIASFVKKGSKIADIGTDHGYIPIWLVKEKISPSAIAMDVRPGPLERADAHVQEEGLEALIQLRLSDGLEKLSPGEADTAVIAGMGGELMIQIMNGGIHMWNSVSQWVLSPQSDLDKVRRFLNDNGFFIENEDMLSEDGKYYTVMSVVKGRGNLTLDAHYHYGKCLIEKKDAVLLEYLHKEKHMYENILKELRDRSQEGTMKRVQEIEDALRIIQEAEDEMQ